MSNEQFYVIVCLLFLNLVNGRETPDFRHWVHLFGAAASGGALVGEIIKRWL